MSKTDGIDVARPEGSRSPKLGDDDIRKLARAVIELINKDHYVGADAGAGSGYNEDAAGEHAKLTLREASDPSQAADKGFLYTKNDGTRTELYWLGETGGSATPKKLTSNGQLNVLDADGVVLTTLAQTIAGVKTFSDRPVFQAGISCAGESANQRIRNVLDPVAAQDAVTKAYLESKIGAGAISPTAYTGQESITFPNGLIMKFGSTSIGAGEVDITFDEAFPNAIATAILTAKTGTPVSYYEMNIISQSKTKLTVRQGAAVTCNWMAIGR